MKCCVDAGPFCIFLCALSLNKRGSLQDFYARFNTRDRPYSDEDYRMFGGGEFCRRCYTPWTT